MAMLRYLRSINSEQSLTETYTHNIQIEIMMSNISHDWTDYAFNHQYITLKACTLAVSTKQTILHSYCFIIA